MANKVTFQKPSEPSFLAQFKQKVGYREAPALSEKFAAKRGAGEFEDENDSDDHDEMKFLTDETRSEEGPVVVQLKKNDMTEEEAKIYTEFRQRKRKSDQSSGTLSGELEATNAQEDVEDTTNAGTKIVFKKPKRDCGKRGNVKGKPNSNHRTKKASAKAVQNKSLLSFDDHEEQEQEISS